MMRSVALLLCLQLLSGIVDAVVRDDGQTATTSRIHVNVVLLTNESMSRSSLQYLEAALTSDLRERDFPFFDGSEPLQDLFSQRLSVSFVPISPDVYQTLRVVLQRSSFEGICDADLLRRLLDELLEEMHLTSNRFEFHLILVASPFPQLSFVTGLLPAEVASIQSRYSSLESSPLLASCASSSFVPLPSGRAVGRHSEVGGDSVEVSRLWCQRLLQNSSTEPQSRVSAFSLSNPSSCSLFRSLFSPHVRGRRAVHLHSSIIGVGDALPHSFPSLPAIPLDQELTAVSASVLAPILIDRIETEFLTKTKAGASRYSESITVNIYTLLTRQDSRGLGSEEKSHLKCALEAITTKEQMLQLTFHNVLMKEDALMTMALFSSVEPKDGQLIIDSRRLRQLLGQEPTSWDQTAANKLFQSSIIVPVFVFESWSSQPLVLDDERDSVVIDDIIVATLNSADPVVAYTRDLTGSIVASVSCFLTGVCQPLARVRCDKAGNSCMLPPAYVDRLHQAYLFNALLRSLQAMASTRANISVLNPNEPSEQSLQQLNCLDSLKRLLVLADEVRHHISTRSYNEGVQLLPAIDAATQQMVSSCSEWKVKVAAARRTCLTTTSHIPVSFVGAATAVVLLSLTLAYYMRPPAKVKLN